MSEYYICRASIQQCDFINCRHRTIHIQNDACYANCNSSYLTQAPCEKISYMEFVQLRLKGTLPKNDQTI